MQEFIHEASKPLARHRGDRDLEDRLKQVERDGDPMLRYIREKKRERGELGPGKYCILRVFSIFERFYSDCLVCILYGANLAIDILAPFC